eukprot:gene8788-8966_t
MGGGKAIRRRRKLMEVANAGNLHKAQRRKAGASAHLPLPAAPSQEDYKEKMPASLRKMLALKLALHFPPCPHTTVVQHVVTWEQPKKLKERRKEYLNAKRQKKKGKGALRRDDADEGFRTGSCHPPGGQAWLVSLRGGLGTGLLADSESIGAEILTETTLGGVAWAFLDLEHAVVEKVDYVVGAGQWTFAAAAKVYASLKYEHFARKRSQQEAAASSSLTGDEDTGELVYPAEEEEYQNSLEGQGTTITDRLTICKRLYAIKVCRKSQFAQCVSRYNHSSRLRRSGQLGSHNNLHSPNSSSACFSARSCGLQTEEMVKEIAILKKLNHPNIVNLVEVIDDPTTDSLLLVMEFVEGGTLEPRQVSSGKWAPLAEKDVWRYVREVLQGLDYLHHHKVVHGDLKPANLLLDSNSNKVKIADFGSSIMAGGDKMFSMRNCPGFSTPAFRSPESLTSGYQPSFEMDMWALGVCIYMWVFGCLPFTGAAPFIIYEKIRNQNVSLPSGMQVSPELLDFVRKLLDKDVLQRLDVYGAMAHPWVTLGGSAPLPSIKQQQMEGGGAMTNWAMACPGGGFAGLQVTQQDIDAAIRQTGSSRHELLDVVFEEVHFQPGQEVISVGEVADCIYLIAHGEVEIVEGAGGSSSTNSSHEPLLISGLQVDLAEQHDSDVWDGEPVRDLSSSPGTARMMLLSDMLAPWGAGGSRQAAGGSGSSCSTGRVLGVKGPGDSLGVPLSHDGSTGGWEGEGDRRWRVSVRARGQATLFKARLDDLEKLVAAHPEMQTAVAQMGHQQETDMMVAEAMSQLRLYNAASCMPGVVMAKS